MKKEATNMSQNQKNKVTKCAIKTALNIIGGALISFTKKMVDDIKPFALMQRLYQVFNGRRTYISSDFVVLKSLACY